MANKAYQRIYTKLEAITKATVSLKAKGVSNDELAVVGGKLAQVVKTKGDLVTLQVFSGTEGIPTNAEVTFLGEPPTLKVSDQLSGRFFNAYGKPIDGGPEVEGEEREIGGPSVNPYKRRQSSELIPTGIAGIDLNNTIVSGESFWAWRCCVGFQFRRPRKGTSTSSATALRRPLSLSSKEPWFDRKDPAKGN